MPPDLDREERLDEVIAAYLKARRAGDAPPRQELMDSHPDLAGDLASFFADQDRFDRLAAPLRQAVPACVRPEVPRNFGDYEVLEEIARGGMGVVYRAWQKSLGRVVALKMLLAGPWAAPADQRRFRAEAESAASLDHPNIVPIYEVGSHEGHPYMTMKLVEGSSLAHVAGRGPWEVTGPAAARRVAGLLATVADAVHYAHQRGILHRDLKPANILLSMQKSECRMQNERQADSSFCILHSDFCIPLVTDFGLAKRTPGRAWDEVLTPGGAVSLAPTVPLPPDLTGTGAIVGTPGYMAPEQASGAAGTVTTAADVYGLGSVLYECLTGRPPFRGETQLDTVRQVLEQEPTRPSALNPKVDRDLETVCLKCLRKEPAGRYASAREVAEDLRRFQGGEPILARPAGPVGRVVRWAHRQPVVAFLTLALAAVLVVGVGLLAVLWQTADRQRRLAERHFRTAEDQRDVAEKNQHAAERHLEDADRSFHLAHQAVHDFCRNVSNELRDAPQFQPLRKALLAAALDYYRDFLRRRGQDPALRRELADTYRTMGEVTGAIGARADERDAYEQALALYRDLHQADPDNLQLQRLLADTQNRIASLADTTEGARSGFLDTVAAYDGYLKKHPDDRGLRAGRAVALGNLGLACQKTGRLAEAADCFARARDAQERLLAESPGNPGLQADLASTLANYSVLRSHEPGGRDDALAALRRACDLRAALAEARKNDPGRQADLAMCQQNLGVVLRDAGREAEALKVFQQAHAIRERLAARHPFITRYQADLAASFTDLGFFHSSHKRKEKGLECYQKARDLQEKLFRLDPGSPGVRRELGLSHFRIGTVCGALGRRPEESHALGQARELQEALVKADPDNLDYRRDLGRTLNNLAWNRMAMNHPDEAASLAARAVEAVAVARTRAPQVAAFRETLAHNYGTLGEAELRRGRTAAAADAFEAQQKLRPGDPEELYRLAHNLARVAAAVGPGGPTPAQQAERRGCRERALAALCEAVERGFRDLGRLRKDGALDPLRGEEAFAGLVRELEKKAGQTQPGPTEGERP